MDGEQRGLDHFGGDVCQLELDQLLGGDWSAELRPLLRVIDGDLEAGPRRAEHAPGDAEASVVEARQRRLEAGGAGKAILLGNARALEDQAPGDRGAHRELVGNILAGELPAFDDEAADPVCGAGPDDGEVRNLRVGDPQLAAGQHPVVAVLVGARFHSCRIGAVSCLGEAEAAEGAARRHFGQPLLLLLFGAEAVDGVHRKTGLHRDERAQSGIAGFELVAGKPVRERAHAGAAVALEIRAEKSQLRQLRHQLQREASSLVVGDDPRHELFADQAAHAGPHCRLVVAQERSPTDQLFEVHGHTSGMNCVAKAGPRASSSCLK